MRIFNQDGSEAEMCGNGIRCVGKFAYDKGLTKKEELLIETKAGIKKLHLMCKDGICYEVKVDMGEPAFKGKDLPFVEEQVVRDLSIQVIDKEFEFTPISMGNPHVVTKMRVWERGSGETLACGTGACAAVVASGINGYTNSNVKVTLPGGDLKVEWNEDDNHVYMTGPATKVFEGEVEDIW